jgi:hypothetical protein
VTGDAPPILLVDRGLLFLANLPGKGTSGMEATARGKVDGTGDIPFKDHFLPIPFMGIGQRHGRNEETCIGVQRFLEYFRVFAHFNALPEEHYSHAVRKVPDHAEVMSDEKEGQAEPLLKVLKEIEDLSPNGDVQGGNRFIADN